MLARPIPIDYIAGVSEGRFFEWDERKAAQNVAFGRPPFDLAMRMDFTTAIVLRDIRMDYGEVRMIALGLVDGRVHVLVYTEREDAIRIISFRRANDREARRYDRETMERHRGRAGDT